MREVRVERSRTRHLPQTSEAELRLRTSEIVAIMLERMTSGRSLTVVGGVEVEVAIDENEC